MEYTERNLITRVLTIYHVELSQSTALEQKRFNSRSPAHRNLWLLLIWLTITLEQSTSCQANVIIVSLHITHIILIWYFTCLSGFAFLWYFPYSRCLVLSPLDGDRRYNCKSRENELGLDRSLLCKFNCWTFI